MSEHMFDYYIGNEVCVTFFYDYQPAEKQTHLYPGCDAECSITSALVDGDERKDIIDVLDSRVIKELEEKIISGDIG